MDKLDIWKKAIMLRKALGEDGASPIDALALAYSIDRLTIVFYPMGDRLSGICTKSSNSNLIAVNSSMSMGRQQFSMAHELYHLYYDDDQQTSVCAKNIGSGNAKEKEADQFASFLLMPPDALADAVKRVKKDLSRRLALKDVVWLEQYFRVSRQEILYRLIDEKELTVQEAEPMRQSVMWSAISLGFNDSLYKPALPNKIYGTYGFFIQQVEKALEKGLISNGKYEELLLTAYRSDLVYGAESEGGDTVD